MGNERPVTYGDILELKEELLRAIKQMPTSGQSKKWLKSKEVRKILDISPGKLQDMRNKDEIPFTRVGGVIYYLEEAVHKMLESKSNINVRG